MKAPMLHQNSFQSITSWQPARFTIGAAAWCGKCALSVDARHDNWSQQSLTFAEQQDRLRHFRGSIWKLNGKVVQLVDMKITSRSHRQGHHQHVQSWASSPSPYRCRDAISQRHSHTAKAYRWWEECQLYSSSTVNPCDCRWWGNRKSVFNQSSPRWDENLAQLTSWMISRSAWYSYC